uniref:Peptidase_M13_N domain-containing protein n=1 Tax=Steinernema glaseri TaxID=37863 RepID=A0A1I7YUJ0_9BILA
MCVPVQSLSISKLILKLKDERVQLQLCCSFFVAALLLVLPVTFFISHKVMAEDVRRPDDEESYLDKAMIMDERFLDQFNYFLDKRKNLTYVTVRQEQSQHIMARSYDPNYRTYMALNLLNVTITQNATDQNVTHAAIRAVEAVGSKHMLRMEHFIMDYIQSVTKRSENVERLQRLINKAKEDYNVILDMVEDVELKERIESHWSHFRTSHTPGIDHHCLRPYPNASELLKVFDSALYFESDCSCGYRKTYWTEDDFETAVAWTYIFVTCVVFGILFSLWSWRNKSHK